MYMLLHERKNERMNIKHFDVATNRSPLSISEKRNINTNKCVIFFHSFSRERERNGEIDREKRCLKNKQTWIIFASCFMLSLITKIPNWWLQFNII